jgi:hypothetical protein
MKIRTTVIGAAALLLVVWGSNLNLGALTPWQNNRVNSNVSENAFDPTQNCVQQQFQCAAKLGCEAKYGFATPKYTICSESCTDLFAQCYWKQQDIARKEIEEGN